MGLAVVLAYIAMYLLSPGDMLPVLIPFRPTLVLALASLPLAGLARLQRPELNKLRVQFVLVSLFFGWALCSWFPHGGIGRNLTTLLELSPNIMVYFVGAFVLGSPVRLSFLRATLVLVAVFILFNALWEMPLADASGASSPYVLAQHSDISHYDLRIRGLGALGDPNELGQFLLMILPMLFVAKRDSGLGIGWVPAILIAILFLTGVYYTGSRGAEMGVAALIGLFLIRKFRTAGAVLSTVLGGSLLLVVNAFRTRTISMTGGMDRLAIWSDGMAYFKGSPLWGIGYDEFPHLRRMTAHNSYLLCAAELGIVGFFLWMSIIVVTLIQLGRVPDVVGKSNPVLARWAVAVRLSLAVYLFTSFFLSRTYQLPLYLLFGVSGSIIAAAGGDEAIPLWRTGWPLWSMGFCVGVLTLIYVMLRLRVA
jgi:O-antigen ligase